MAKVKQAAFRSGKGFSDQYVAEKAKRFHNGLEIPADRLQHGVQFSYRNLNQITRTKIAAEMEAMGMKDVDPSRLQYFLLPQSTADDAVYSYFNKCPVTYDAAVDPASVSEAAQQVKDWHAHSLGFTEMVMPGIDKEKDFVPAGTNAFGKALTSDVTALHAIADTDIAILNADVQIAQNIFRKEAAYGKDVIFDISKPFNYAAAYYGTELQDLVDSDFELATRTDQLYFMFCNGMISDAAVKFGLSAYPRRDFMSLETLMHQLGARALRERRTLGINSNVNDTEFTWENQTPGLNFAGLHEFATRRVNHNEDKLSCVVSGADVNTGTTSTEKFEILYKHINAVGYKMMKAGQKPTLMMADWATGELIAENVIPNARYIDYAPSKAFGISTIQLNVLGIGPMELVIHPWLPSASGQSSLYMIDPNMMSFRVGWTDTMELLGKYANLSTRFAISSAETFIDKSDATGNHTLMGAVLGITHPDYL